MKTKDYQKFKLLDDNRPISEAYVKRIAESMRKYGFLESKPIIVNKEHEIIDGQHRFKAAIMLDIPVVFDFENIGREGMIDLNKTQTVWRLNEYIYHYAKHGIAGHNEIIQFENKYKLGISNSISVCTGNQHNTSDKIRHGLPLHVNPNANKIAEIILLMNGLPFHRTKSFVGAITTVYLKIKHDKKLIEKLIAKHLLISQQAKVVDYLAVIENILNKRNQQPISLTK